MTSQKTFKKKFKDKKILILGFAKEGQDNYIGLRKIFPSKPLAIADKLRFDELEEKTRKLIRDDVHLKLFCGKNYLKRIKNYDVIIKSPGINHRIIKPYLSQDSLVTSQTKIFFDYCPGKIIGITGTKGKGTTASLVFQILKMAREKVYLVGNIGKPVFSLLFRAKKEDVYIYELSSHQLENLKKSPSIAVFLNIYPDHLDYYKNFKEYFSAKKNITLYQNKNNYFIYNKENKDIRALARETKAKKIPFSLKDKEKVYELIKKNEVPLRGEFNLYNIIAAILTVRLLDTPDKDIKKGLKNFKPLAHHLEYVSQRQGIDFYNDSFATIPEASIAAIKAFSGKIGTIILGGSSKGKIDFSKLAEAIIQSKAKNLILFPETGQAIWKEVVKKTRGRKKQPQAFFVSSMSQAVRRAYNSTPPGTICLLSPACASFTTFRNYKERGNLFKKYVRQLK
jgi:UDP-N-acetylmuramoyl-L-alanine---L-glutamate ligase